MEMESEDMEMEQGGILRDEAVALLNTYKYNVEVASKMEPLRKLREVLIHRDPRLLPEFVPYLMELQSERFSPIRKFLVEMIEEIGLKYLEHLPAMVPVLIAFLKDDTPAVARQAVTTGTNLFRNTLEQVTLQGIYSGQVHKWLEDTWAWMVKFKDAVYPIAVQPGADGAKLVAVKFVETTILLFTSDPNVSLQVPPPQQSSDGKSKGFNISWILGGHPVLDAGLLGQEASKNLGFLLDQLRLPDVRVLQSSVAIVLINSLSSIAKKRPGLYGRVLPALLGLVSSFEGVKGPQFASVQNTLKNAFVGFLKCTHPGALPWRDRLVGALRAMNAADLAEQVLRQVDKMLKNVEHSSEASSEQKPPNQHYNILAGEAGQKRALVQDNGNQTTMDDKQVKRIRHSSPVLQQFQFSCHLKNESATSNGNCPGVLKIDPEMSPVQQLVAMFGAIVAQGDRAVESLEILISKIPTDLLAEVVIANMHNLPSTPPQSDSDEHELPGGISQSSIIGTMSHLMPSLNIISQVMQLSTSIPPTSMPLMTLSQVPSAKNITSSEVKAAVSQQLTSDTSHNNLRDSGWLDTQHMPVPIGVSLAPASIEDTTAAPFIPGGGVNSLMTTQPLIESQCLTTISNKDQKEGPQNIIPGIGGPLSVDIKMETVEKSVDSFSVPVTATPNTLSTGSESNEMQEPLLSGPPGTDKFGPAIPQVPALEPIRSSSLVPITTMTVAPASGFAAVPTIITLTVEQQASLSRSAFARIIEAYRQVSLAGGCELRVSLLTRLADQCDADYDAREILQKHILSDYHNFKGHEMTMHVLYRLFGEIVSKEKDTGLPPEVDSIYESFLLIVAQTLRDSLPASDKSLSKLLGEVPLLPDAAFKILEDLCCVGRFDKDGKEMQSGERVVQGLSAVWSLILLRPPSRDICLDIALKTAVHRIEEVRTRAIRLVANKLYPLSYISQNIEEFATKMMLSVANAPQNGDSMDFGASRIVGKETDTDLPNGRPKVTEGSGITGENTNGNDQPTSAHSVSNLSVTEALRCMSLYFALCTKKPTLLQQVFSIYKTAPKAAKQAVQRQMGPLIHTISLTGVPSDLLRIISNPSAGSENLLMQVLHLLTDRVTPPPELIATVKKLFETKLKDAGVLIPILSSLTKDEVLPIFPQLVNLPLEKFQDALARILQGSAHTGPALTPAEVLIAIHGIDPEREGIPLKKVTDACSACFEQRKVFTQQVLAKVLNQLVEQTPLPLLFMRTVIQAVGAFPSLMDFIMEILSRLVNKQIWKFPKLWVGFLKCAYQTKPHSFHVLLQLPATQLENALNKNPALKSLLVGHANQPSIRSTLPRSTLVVLGLVQDNQSANTASQTPQPMDATPAGQTGNETQASESAAAS